VDIILRAVLVYLFLLVYREKLPEYAHILGPGAGNKKPHEFNAIFFDPTRLTVLDSGGFWLSQTPDRHSSAWRTRVALRELGEILEPERQPLLTAPEHAPRPRERPGPREG
jgi:hypothetical protein